MPSCPGWTLSDLVQHLVRAGAATPPRRPGRTSPPPSATTPPRAAPGSYEDRGRPAGVRASDRLGARGAAGTAEPDRPGNDEGPGGGNTL
ncbi:maleylpyruvate isomerase N-terminal domain-containing protein [Streptomyces sp. TN58]|uniref:maleylpyruvate isomerase N-terminal domain-containing protein n=1 Tax=Streptomyces sp. TN58 TaxID=234612 RepID=UPI001331BA2E|nr:maleylpyruvate isomerase N-terminal domain-containing protein [Streptomyces sp. TN58]